MDGSMGVCLAAKPPRVAVGAQSSFFGEEKQLPSDGIGIVRGCLMV